MVQLNTGTNVDWKADGGNRQPNSGLSTQIVIKVDNQPVGALQRLSVNQSRQLERVKEIGTDGVVEIIPNQATTFELTASRLVFDQLRLPEAFARGFRFINAQRLPFDIDVYDLSAIKSPNGTDTAGIVVMTYKNCWFTSYSTPYAADTYLITEEATLWCERAFISNPDSSSGKYLPNNDIRSQKVTTDTADIEKSVNYGGRLGSLDASGVMYSVFGEPK
jgi:hypothetical protein